jgi:hypothetical protein
MEDLKKLHYKPKVSIIEINEFILQHPNWAATIIRTTLESEMYLEFCLCWKNFDTCWKKFGTIKKEMSIGCICKDFFNEENFGTNRPRLRAYLKKVTVMLKI